MSGLESYYERSDYQIKVPSKGVARSTFAYKKRLNKIPNYVNVPSINPVSRMIAERQLEGVDSPRLRITTFYDDSPQKPRTKKPIIKNSLKHLSQDLPLKLDLKLNRSSFRLSVTNSTRTEPSVITDLSFSELRQTGQRMLSNSPESSRQNTSYKQIAYNKSSQSKKNSMKVPEKSKRNAHSKSNTYKPRALSPASPNDKRRYSNKSNKPLYSLKYSSKQAKEKTRRPSHYDNFYI